MAPTNPPGPAQAPLRARTRASRSNPVREGTRLTQSVDATHAVVVAVLKSRMRLGNVSIEGVNTAYPNAALFETHVPHTGPSPDAYVTRWFTYNGVHRYFAIVALVYIDRVSATCPAFMLTKWNFHRVFAAAAIVASRTIDPDAHSPQHMAQLAGLQKVHHMRELETAFLRLLRHHRTVSRRNRRTAEIAYQREALASPSRRAVARTLEQELIEEVD